MAFDPFQDPYLAGRPLPFVGPGTGLRPGLVRGGKRVLRYAAALTRTPADDPEELYNRPREHFNPQQTVELTAASAWENFRSRFNRGFGIEAEGFSEGAVCPVHVAERAAPDGAASNPRGS